MQLKNLLYKLYAAWYGIFFMGSVDATTSMKRLTTTQEPIMEQQEVRSRTRAGGRAGMDLGGTKTQPKPSSAMIAHARAAYEANKEKNKRSRDESAAKKALQKLIAQVEGLSSFAVTVVGKVIDVTWAKGSKEVVDVAKLRKIVKDDDALFAILSVSKADVEEAYGSNVANGALITSATDHKLTIKERK